MILKMGKTGQFVVVSIVYNTILFAHIYVGDGAQFALGGVFGVAFAVFGLRAIGRVK